MTTRSDLEQHFSRGAPDGVDLAPGTRMHYGNVFDPQSPLAGATTSLLNATLVVCGAIFALVAGLVIYNLFRFRARPAEMQEPAQLRGNARLEFAWTLVPFLLLAYLFVLTVGAMHASDPSGKNREPDLTVIGHQFWWEVRYPNGVVTANEIHIPSGRSLLVRLETADVIHTFWVPQLSRKMQMLPDRSNYIWIGADHPGRYLGACAQFCGAQHAWMRIRVVADTPEEFGAWEARQLKPAPPARSDAAVQGAKWFRQLTCAVCHSIRGLQAAPPAAPDLTHLASRDTLGAGVLENTPENLARWIDDSQRIKPGNLMPRMHLTQAQTASLVAYLETLQ